MARRVPYFRGYSMTSSARASSDRGDLVHVDGGTPEEVAKIRSVGDEAVVRYEVARIEHLGQAVSAAELDDAMRLREEESDVRIERHREHHRNRPRPRRLDQPDSRRPVRNGSRPSGSTALR
jgi:hypothetical protein